MVERYRLNGDYHQNGLIRELEGSLFISNGNLIGTMTGTIIDKLSPINVREVKGKKIIDGDRIVLDFLVVVPYGDFLNIHYVLSKKGTDEVSGTYSGFWIPEERFIDSKARGSHPLHSGEEAYFIQFPFVPKEGDLKQQEAQITLEKAA